MLRFIAVILNFLVLAFSVFIIADEGMPTIDDGIIIIFPFVLLISPLLNLIYIFSKKGGMIGIWPFIYFKRKALEERLKIEKLMQENQREGK